LITEPTNPYDTNAVRVEIDGRHVGYLARDVAKRFAPFVASAQPITCQPELHGGTPDKPSIGVVLDFTAVYELREKTQPFQSTSVGCRTQSSC